MAAPSRIDLRAGRRSRRGSPSISAASCALAAQKSNRASASSVSRSGSAFAATSADSSSRIRSISSCSATCASRQALPSSTATSGSMNSVWPLPDASWTMPLTRAPGLGLDRDDVAAVAERDDRLLERAAELRADERVEPAPQPVVGDADRGPQPAEARRRGVEQLAGRVEAAGERRADRRQRVELAGERVEQRPAVVGERRLEPGRRVERVGDLEELRGIEAAAARRALDRRARCRARRRSRRRAAPASSARAWSVSSRPRATMTGSRRWLERLGEPPRRRERGRRRRAARGRAGTRAARSSGRPSRSGARASGAGPRPTGCRRSTNRHGTLRPRRAGVGDPDPRRRDDVAARLAGGRRLEAERRRRVEQVEPGHRRGRCRTPAATRPGPAARPRSGDGRGGRAALARPRAARRARRARHQPGRASRIASTPSSGSTARTSSAAGRPSASVTMFRQSYIP